MTVWCPVAPDCTMPLDQDGECEAHPGHWTRKNREGTPDDRFPGVGS